MMNVWTPSSLSSQSPSSSVFLVGWHIASTFPRRLWDAYVTYLWYYQPNSWVGRLASTFRILAVILVLPVVLLTLLDVTSYVIARTLGIVDDVKASTSDADTSCSSDARDQMGASVGVGGMTTTMRTTSCMCPLSSDVSTSTTASSASHGSHGVGVGVGSVHALEGFVPEENSVERRAESDGNGNGNGDGDAHGYVPETVAPVSTAHAHTRTTVRRDSQSQTQTQTRTDQETSSGVSPHTYYFAAEAGLRLAGEGVFSPAVSMPPSPITPRMPLHTFDESDGREAGQVSEEIVLRRRVQNAREDET